MDEQWRLCTRPVCRLRSDRSRDRQIYTRRRRAIKETLSAGRVAEFEHLSAPDQPGDNGTPGRYCPGLCETEMAAADTHRRLLLKKPSKG